LDNRGKEGHHVEERDEVRHGERSQAPCLLPWSREEERGALLLRVGEEGMEERLWRLKKMEGWEWKIAKCKGRWILFIEEALRLGFLMGWCWGLVLKCYESRTRQHRKC
jgi:hypothetical protein